MKLNSRGFTLTELLIVIVITAIIAGIGATNYLTSLKRGHDGKRMADLNNLRNALEMYYLDQNTPHYPLGPGHWAGAGVLEGDLVLVERYIQEIPSDPKSGWEYWYTPLDSGNCYCLSARMEVEDTRPSIGSCSCPPAHSGACYLVTCP